MAKGTKKSKGVNLTKMRDEELVPIARKLLLAIAARTDLSMGSGETITTEGATAYYQDIYKNVVIPVLLEADIKIQDIDYLFQLMSQPIHFVKEVTSASMVMNRDAADSLLYGVKDIRQLSIKQLDEALKKNAKNMTEVAKDKAKNSKT